MNALTLPLPIRWNDHSEKRETLKIQEVMSPILEAIGTGVFLFGVYAFDFETVHWGIWLGLAIYALGWAAGGWLELDEAGGLHLRRRLFPDRHFSMGEVVGVAFGRFEGGLDLDSETSDQVVIRLKGNRYIHLTTDYDLHSVARLVGKPVVAYR